MQKQISISEEIYCKVERLRLQMMPTSNTIDAFVENLLEQIYQVYSRQEDNKVSFSTEEDKLVEDRLRRLGYL